MEITVADGFLHPPKQRGQSCRQDNKNKEFHVVGSDRAEVFCGNNVVTATTVRLVRTEKKETYNNDQSVVREWMNGKEREREIIWQAQRSGKAGEF